MTEYGHLGDPRIATSKVLHGPRGNYYEWCCLEKDNTLTFGNEEGNYAGGATFFYGKKFKPFNTSGIDQPEIVYEGEVYWEEVKQRLGRIKEYDSVFYANIQKMLTANNFEFPQEV